MDTELFDRLRQNGIPSYGPRGRVFARLDPEAFRQWFVAWIDAVAELAQGEAVARDGKPLRRSYERNEDKTAIHRASTWAVDDGVALGQDKPQA